MTSYVWGRILSYNSPDEQYSCVANYSTRIGSACVNQKNLLAMVITQSDISGQKSCASLGFVFLYTLYISPLLPNGGVRRPREIH